MAAKERAPRRTAKTTPPATGSDGAISARSMRLQKLDGDGQPVGEPVQMGSATIAVGQFEAREAYGPDGDTQPVTEMSFEVPLSEVPPAVIRDLTRIPVPTAVMDRWFPAFVRWPGEDQLLTRCKVFATPQGLYVYSTVPTEQETSASGAHPDRYAPINFEKTTTPPIGTVARNAGIRIATPDGNAIVQPTGGCGCGSRLKSWTPRWARNSVTWTDGAALAANATTGR
jgi:hypothetical protein